MDFCMKLLKAEWKVNQQEKISNATWFVIWWWLCCTQTGSWGQRGMEMQRKAVKNLLSSRRLLMMMHCDAMQIVKFCITLSTFNESRSCMFDCSLFMCCYKTIYCFCRFCSFDGANENVWHILVCIFAPFSVAYIAGSGSSLLTHTPQFTG